MHFTYICAWPSFKRKCFFRVMIAWENKVGNYCSRETNSPAILQFYKSMVSITRTARWTRSAPFNLFCYAQYCRAIKACVYQRITSLQFFRLLFSCIFISSKTAKFLDLIIHPQFSNIVIFGEQYMFWSSSVRNSLLSHNTFSPFGPHTVFSTSFSDIMRDLPNHMKISEVENLLFWRSIGLNWKIRISILQYLAS